MENKLSRLAVLIDGDNVDYRHASEILERTSQYGVSTLRQVYGDWSDPSLNGWLKFAKIHGIAAKQITPNSNFKNATDIGLVIDAMDMLHSRRFDGFVLVSSDSDFTSLATRLRQDGVKVFGIGKDDAPQSLTNVCDDFHMLQPAKKGTSKTTGTTVNQCEVKPPSAQFRALVLAATHKMTCDNAGWFCMSQLGNQLKADWPEIKYSDFGNKALNKVLTLDRQFELASKNRKFRSVA